MSGWRWNGEKGWYLTGVDAAIAKNDEYRQQFGLTREEYDAALSNPPMALAIIQMMYEDPGITWVGATMRVVLNPLIEVAGFTPFDETIEEAVSPDPLEEQNRLRNLIGQMLLSR